MRKLLMKGGDLQVLQFETKDMKKVQNWLKIWDSIFCITGFES